MSAGIWQDPQTVHLLTNRGCPFGTSCSLATAVCWATMPPPGGGGGIGASHWGGGVGASHCAMQTCAKVCK